jgi:hypothetical protein
LRQGRTIQEKKRDIRPHLSPQSQEFLVGKPGSFVAHRPFPQKTQKTGGIGTPSPETGSLGDSFMQSNGKGGDWLNGPRIKVIGLGKGVVFRVDAGDGALYPQMPPGGMETGNRDFQHVPRFGEREEQGFQTVVTIGPLVADSEK